MDYLVNDIEGMLANQQYKEAFELTACMFVKAVNQDMDERPPGRAEDYENELWLLMLQYKAGDVTVYKELKTLYTAKEWSVKREKIFDKLPCYTAVDKLYKEDQLYDRLLKLVLDSNGLYKLMEYEECLKSCILWNC